MSVLELRTVATPEAARLLGVRAPTLAAWERQFGFPSSLSRPGERRRFPLSEVLALRDALRREASIAEAVRCARRRLATDRDSPRVANLAPVGYRLPEHHVAVRRRLIELITGTRG